MNNSKVNFGGKYVKDMSKDVDLERREREREKVCVCESRGLGEE
jgi:hypothetical protein